MKIHQQGAKKFNKTCSLEVSIELLPLILIVSSKKSCQRELMKICQQELRYLTKDAVQ